MIACFFLNLGFIPYACYKHIIPYYVMFFFIEDLIICVLSEIQTLCCFNNKVFSFF